MTNAISINIGLNYVDPNCYNGWNGALSGCVNDAIAMQKIADGLDYASIPILNEEATADRIISEIGQAAWNLDENGILLLTYSGHGGQMTDVNGDEDDGKDETWVLYDRQLIDDELFNMWNQFNTGARLVVLSDSCHSGTVTENLEYMAVAQSSVFGQYRTRSGPPRFRGIPAKVGEDNYQANKKRYDALQFASGTRTRNTMAGTILLISGCQDNQLSNDGDANGLFTGELLKVWNNGGFSGSYAAFHQAILGQMPSTQTPNYYVVGADNPDFEAQTPFTVEPPSRGAPVGPTASWPSIKGPASVSRGSALVFQVNAGPGRYYAVEVAADANLFDAAAHGGERRPDNFYGSWSDTAFMQSSSYTLPASWWGRLKNNNRLYYRIYSNDSANGWGDYKLSSADTAGTAIPSLAITG